MSYKIGFIGGGNMATAILQGILSANITDASHITVSDPSAERRVFLDTLGVNTTAVNDLAVQNSDYIFLAIKPKHVEQVFEELTVENMQGKVFISIVAGLSTQKLESYLPEEAQIVRVMPNTPALIQMGMSVISDDYTADDEQLTTVKSLLATVGEVAVVSASLMDAVTAVSGSGPAYAYMFIDAMAMAGVRLGLTKETALKLAVQTVKGSAAMIEQTGKHPAALKDMVCSPAGTTIEAVCALEATGFNASIINAVCACAEKSKAMSK